MNFKTIVLLSAAALTTGSCKFLARQIVDYSETWASGLPKSRGSLAEGKQSGEWVFYYESGRPRAKGEYADDRMTGPWTFYHENGVVERTGAFDAAGRRTGEWTFQYPDQTPQARGAYVEDFEDGHWTFYHENGVVEREGQFTAGKLSGPWNYFYENGKPRASGMCFAGQRVGVWSLWSDGGVEGQQDFGTRKGLEIVLESGPSGLRRAGVLVDGVPQGRWTTYHDNGQRRFCCTMTNGVPSGTYEVRDADGTVLAQGTIQDGRCEVPGMDGSLLLADVQRPVERDAVVAKPTETLPPPPAVVATVATRIEDEPARVPAPVQPDLTVKQKREMDQYVREYTEGPRPGGSSLFSTYAPDVGRARPSGQGERAELIGQPLPFQVLRGVDGQEVDLRQYRGKKRVMLVVLRGFLGEVCCYCVAQTKALAQSRDRLEELGIEVLVLYPGPRENEQSFEQAYRMTFNEGSPPYRVFYDPDLELVTKLGIEGDLASPSTFVIDKDGIVRYAYVGEHRADRPAAKKLIKIIEGLEQ